MFLGGAKSTHYVPNLEKVSRIRIFRGVCLDYFNITWGWGGGVASSQFITILHSGGGVYQDPTFVLCNKWTAPYDI